MTRAISLMVIFCFLCLFMAGGCASSYKNEQDPVSFQDRCGAPVWEEGDSWKFIGSGCGSWEEKIVGKNDKIDVRQNPTKQFYGFFNIPFVGLGIFPLRVGKRVEGMEILHTAGGMRLPYFYSFTVSGKTDVKVEAGTFQCYRIELRITPSVFSQEGVGTFYYAPKTKSIVKFETDSPLLAKWETYELFSFALTRHPSP